MAATSTGCRKTDDYLWGVPLYRSCPGLAPEPDPGEPHHRRLLIGLWQPKPLIQFKFSHGTTESIYSRFGFRSVFSIARVDHQKKPLRFIEL